MRVPTITCPICTRSSTHPDDISTGYCGNCHDFTGTAADTNLTVAAIPPLWDGAGNFEPLAPDSEFYTQGSKIRDAAATATKWSGAEFAARWRMVSVLADVLTPALAALDVAPILSGDTVPQQTREILYDGDGVSLRRGTFFYNVDCEPIENLPFFETLEIINAVRTSGGELSAKFFNDDGVPIQIHTTFMGIDMGKSGLIPLIWETLVVVGDDLSIGVLEPIRYATRAAAYAGHSAVTETVLEAIGQRQTEQPETTT